ncbi:transcription initiation factor TFIID subunit 4-like isoform X1 [Lingula anatina]|uniref:Transcription initiation factor TFIID subunit 4-like isoform X1 n=1 Tax=Lingula anatina TaxID=7574 RepID=A0A1S3JKB1_LINAN|nr:transcription initiation factor TFIID subunit 4-like isoform X1 [Lingula anatina]|eukprot:XP_013410808.1 transcription initiation factor TFIID subunit 4-like isoform X1 [Lingula anatina]
MATSNPLEEILNLDVDENAISAVIGSLESQLASPTLKDVPHQISINAGTHNHVNSQQVSGASTSASQTGSNHTHTVASGTSVPSSQISNAGPNVNKGALHPNQLIGINSIISSGRSTPQNSASSGVTVITGGVTSSPQLTGGGAQGEVKVVTQTQSILQQTQPSSVVRTNVQNSGPNVIISQSCGAQNSSSSLINHSASNAIYNLATIAAEQKPLAVTTQNQQQQQQQDNSQYTSGIIKVENSGERKPMVITTATGNSSQKSQIVLKQDTKMQPQSVATTMKQESSPSTPARTIQILNSANANTTLKGSTPGTSNVITVNAIQQQQQGVFRPTITTSIGGSQIQFVTTTNPAGTAVGQKSLAPRIVQTPIRIAAAPQQQPLLAPRPGSNTITLPAGMQLPPGTVLMKNESGQLMVVHTGNPNIVQQQQQPQLTTVAGGTQQYRFQQAKVTQAQARASPTSLMTVKSGAAVAGMQSIARATTPRMSPTPQRAPVPTVVHAVPAGAAQAGPRAVTPQGQIQQASKDLLKKTLHTVAHTIPNPMEQSTVENVKKCKNFLSTLIKLASNQPPETVKNVRALIQGLIDGRIEPEAFTQDLQVALKSSPQPYLVPFLKKSLPLLRAMLTQRQIQIEGVRAPLTSANSDTTPSIPATVTSMPVPVTMTTTLSAATTVVSGSQQQVIPQAIQQKYTLADLQAVHMARQKQAAVVKQGQGQAGVVGMKPGTTVMHMMQGQAPHHPGHKEKRRYESLKDDDDINDVATMGGVNLSEESRNILASTADFIGTQLRSCKDEAFLSHPHLLQKVNAVARKYGLEDVPKEVANLISHATQERLRNILEKLATVAEHRLEIYKNDSYHEVTSDVKQQLKFLEELDKQEKKRKEEQEREMLLRAAKSRSKNEDPEQLKLKQKAKELQQAEMEEVRQREANLTALAAIGPRKKKKLDSEVAQGSSSVGVGSSPSSASASRPSMLRPRIKRVTLRDLVFLLEEERETCKSPLLYKAFLK